MGWRGRGWDGAAQRSAAQTEGRLVGSEGDGGVVSGSVDGGERLRRLTAQGERIRKGVL